MKNMRSFSLLALTALLSVSAAPALEVEANAF